APAGSTPPPRRAPCGRGRLRRVRERTRRDVVGRRRAARGGAARHDQDRARERRAAVRARRSRRVLRARPGAL
ncbi:MAG: hypothetical protein AVDCRST_MAG85-2256, partial [uncultured Solirubrobacteraceae bacterium]